MFVYLENVKNSAIRFQVLSYDADTKIAVLLGQYGARFNRNISKEALAQYGYKVVQSETELSLKSPDTPPPEQPGNTIQ